MSVIVETKQVVDLAVLLTAEIAKVSKDGFQFADLITMFQDISGDAAKKAEFEAAVAGIKDVPAELKSLDLAGSIELGIYIAEKIPVLIASFKAAPVTAPAAAPEVIAPA